tara:strand:+ start:1388 stop:3325 length:1938 start_codon:yes stop_codon:yes gene_type:complete
MAQVVQSKLLYISSINRSVGTLSKFGVNIESAYTKLQDTANSVRISLVDAEIRSTWTNVRATNKSFWLSNYDVNLVGNENINPQPPAGAAPYFYDPLAVPPTPASGYYDTPNHIKITLDEGNYNIRELAAELQNALNRAMVNDGAGPDCTATYCAAPAYVGGAVLGFGSLWWAAPREVTWSVSWEHLTGSMKFEYSGALATTDLFFDFRTKGDFNLYTYGLQTAAVGPPVVVAKDEDIRMGAFELAGYNRSSYQTNAGGLQIPFPYPIGTDIPTAANNTGTEISSPNPAVIGSPTAVYIHSSLPMENVGGSRDIKTERINDINVAVETNNRFSGSGVLGKAINMYQWYSLIPFQAKNNNYSLMMSDLRYINKVRFEIADQYGEELITKHDWSLTLLWEEINEHGEQQSTLLKEQNELIKLLLIQGEKNKILPPPSKNIKSIANIWKTKKERMEEDAKHAIEVRDGDIENEDEIVNKEQTKHLAKGLTSQALFGDDGGENGGSHSAPEDNPNDETSWWVRSKRPTGDGGPLFKGEMHLTTDNGVPYSYAGPGTHFKTRQKRGDKGINNLDMAAKIHDFHYADPFATKSEIRVADLELQQAASAVAEKYPELRTDAKIVNGLFDLKKLAVNAGLVSSLIFTSSKHRK